LPKCDTLEQNDICLIRLLESYQNYEFKKSKTVKACKQKHGDEGLKAELCYYGRLE
jgi:hypothetical protein